MLFSWYELKIDESQTLVLCFPSTSEKLFEMDWLVIASKALKWQAAERGDYQLRVV
jgi:hypothetical protein